MWQENYFSDFEAQEAMDEMRRLTYVAMTRASEQLFVVITDAKTKRGLDDKPLRTWLDCLDTPEHTLPERLTPYIGWLSHDALKDSIDTVLQSSQVSTPALDSEANPAQQAQYIDYRAAEAQRQQHYFQGWTKTSFTALARQLTEQSHELAVFDDAIEDDLVSSHMRIGESTQAGAAEDIRFSFVKGANAGTFLHQVLEKIDFDQPQTWSTVIDQGIRQYQLPNHYLSTPQTTRRQTNAGMPAADDTPPSPQHIALKDWLASILAAPLCASGQPLHTIAPRQRMAELGFNMGLAASFNPEQLNAIFAAHLPNEPDKHINLSASPMAHIYRYLRGEIDLVYAHAGKYYVVDYKSNYLGANDVSYDPEQLKVAMSHAGYWLQAAIYQVALHRLLKLRITDYQGNEATYLGAVEYLFLRGIGHGAQSGYGRITWDVPVALVLALDDFFGLPSR